MGAGSRYRISVKHEGYDICFRRIGSHGYGFFTRIAEADATRKIRHHSVEAALLIGCKYNLIHKLTHKDQPPYEHRAISSLLP